MTTATFTFTPINDGASYTIAALNNLFSAIATVIAGKLDCVTAPEGVVATAAITLSADMAAGQSIINVVDGVDDADAITVAQAKRMLS